MNVSPKFVNLFLYKFKHVDFLSLDIVVHYACWCSYVFLGIEDVMGWGHAFIASHFWKVPEIKCHKLRTLNMWECCSCNLLSSFCFQDHAVGFFGKAAIMVIRKEKKMDKNGCDILPLLCYFQPPNYKWLSLFDFVTSVCGMPFPCKFVTANGPPTCPDMYTSMILLNLASQLFRCITLQLFTVLIFLIDALTETIPTCFYSDQVWYLYMGKSLTNRKIIDEYEY